MATKVRLLLSSSVLLLSTIWLIGCGHYSCGTTFGSATCAPGTGGISTGTGGGNSIAVTAFVYFMDPSAGQLALEGLNVADSQTFAPVSSFVSPVLPQFTDGGIVMVNKSFLYLPFPGNGTLFGFSIDATSGALTAVPNSPYTNVSFPESIAADPKGAVLFVGGSAGITAFTVSPTDGSLTFVGLTPTTAGPTQLVTDGLGKYVYALTGSTISAFSYTSSGALTAVPGSSFASAKALTQIAGEASGTAIFGITGTDTKVFVFSIAQAISPGALTLSSTVPTTFSPVNLAVSPNGKFVYTFNETTTGTSTTIDPMEGFSFSSGTLTELSGISPFTALTATNGKFEQSGQFLFAEGVAPSSSVGGTFSFGANTSTGALTDTLPSAGVPGTSFAVTDAP